jgi:8-oxo-dGTP pyrophosphatase MutT (NUDIX family)
MQQNENPWQIIGSEKIYDNPWISLTEFKVINPGGGKGIYGKVHFKNLAVGVAAIDEEGYLWMVGQYRFPLDQYSWEIPEGGCPMGTDPLEAAQRELREETGLIAKEWTKLLEIHLSNSVSDEFGIIWKATGLIHSTPEPEETERLDIKKISLTEAYRLVENFEITDSLSVAAIQRLWIDELKKGRGA